MDVWVGGFFVHPYDFIVHIIVLEGIRYFTLCETKTVPHVVKIGYIGR